MVAGCNADGKLSGKKMEGDDNLRTVECLRGRLVAERAASRAAKEDAEQMENKLTELENKLRAEIKSRNRAEKRLKLLMKKLESLDLSFVSENSSVLGKSDMSSVSSSSSTNCANYAIEDESKKKSPKISQDLEDIASSQTTAAPDLSHCSSVEESSKPEEENPSSEEPSEVNSSQNYHDLKTDDLGSSCSISDQAQDDYVDNSLALVPVDLPMESRPPDPVIVNASVRDVLDALRHAREKLQLSMEIRSHMIKVGSK